MPKFLTITAIFAGLFVSAPAFAANQQVDADTYRASGKSPFYGRSDGVFFHKTYKSPRLIGNGDGFAPLGPTYFEDFDIYGDGLGLHCSGVYQGAQFTVAASADAVCTTTCGNSQCVAGFEAALADAGDILACSDAAADACICMTTGLDRELAGCGTDWEIPAEGVTLVSFASGVKLGHAALLAQAIGPDMDADGLDISGDAVDDDGNEIFGAMYGATGRPMYPNVDPAFQFCATVDISDVSGTDDFWVGWRKAEAPNATFNNYDTYAVIGFDNTSGDVHTETEDDGASLTTTDVTLTAVADDIDTKYCVLVSDTGAVTYTVDGAAASDAVAFTFDAGEPVIPFIHFLHATTSPDEIVVMDWEVSYQ